MKVNLPLKILLFLYMNINISVTIVYKTFSSDFSGNYMKWLHFSKALHTLNKYFL